MTSSLSGITSSYNRKFGPKEVRKCTHCCFPICICSILGGILTLSVIYSVSLHDPTPAAAVIAAVVLSAVVVAIYLSGIFYLYYKRRERERRVMSQKLPVNYTTPPRNTQLHQVRVSTEPQSASNNEPRRDNAPVVGLGGPERDLHRTGGLFDLAYNHGLPLRQGMLEPITLVALSVALSDRRYRHSTAKTMRQSIIWQYPADCASFAYWHRSGRTLEYDCARRIRLQRRREEK
jgi:hypothetical protein